MQPFRWIMSAAQFLFQTWRAVSISDGSIVIWMSRIMDMASSNVMTTPDDKPGPEARQAGAATTLRILCWTSSAHRASVLTGGGAAMVEQSPAISVKDILGSIRAPLGGAVAVARAAETRAADG